MNISPIANLNSTKIGVNNQSKEAAVTVWCTVTGLTQVLDTRTRFNTVTLSAVAAKYQEKFTQENPAN